MIIRASSPQAAEEFTKAYEEYKDAIFRHCYFHCGEREKALELVQDAYMKTWEYLASGHDLENVRAFLYRVATNLFLNSTRKKPAHSLEDLQEKGFDPGLEDPAFSHDIIAEEHVIKTLEQLEEPYRTALVLRFVEDLTPAEIGEITGESANVISVRVNRGIKKLRSLITKDGSQGE
jgi:RNA polymerase sigma-70 factor, ECF subfamily